MVGEVTRPWIRDEFWNSDGSPVGEDSTYITRIVDDGVRMMITRLLKTNVRIRRWYHRAGINAPDSYSNFEGETRLQQLSSSAGLSTASLLRMAMTVFRESKPVVIGAL